MISTPTKPRRTIAPDPLERAAIDLAGEVAQTVDTLGSFVEGSVKDMSRRALFALLRDLGELGRRADRLTLRVARAADENRG